MGSIDLETVEARFVLPNVGWIHDAVSSMGFPIDNGELLWRIPYVGFPIEDTVVRILS